MKELNIYKYIKEEYEGHKKGLDLNKKKYIISRMVKYKIKDQ